MAEKKSRAEEYFTDGEFAVDLNDRYRYYYGLAPIDSKWESMTFYSVTHCFYKRTIMFFDGNSVKKMIFEEKNSLNGGQVYRETDVEAETVDRKLLIPKTERGKNKSLTPTSLQNPTYSRATLEVALCQKNSGISVFNPKNDQILPVLSDNMNSKDDFIRLTEDYISSCPENYDDVIQRFRTIDRPHVKFRAGDIFRIQITPTLYTYCLILGKVRDILKWEELDKNHPLQKVMAQPIVYRQFAIVTDNPDMTAQELCGIPMLDCEFAQDNEILWGTYPIAAHKALEKSDIDLGFSASSYFKSISWGLTYHELGDEFEQIFDAETDMSSYGMHLFIQYNDNDLKKGEITVTSSKADELKKRITEYFGLDASCPCDDFSCKFGGITRSQYIELANERFR